jgi:periplasmic divalent cation tolerance protein
MQFSMIYTLCGSTDEAKKIAQFLIGENAAACVNILSPTESFYRWEGKLEHSQEIPVLIKTPRDRCEDAVQVIKTHHAYEIPAIIVWDAESANEDYSSWVKENLK